MTYSNPEKFRKALLEQITKEASSDPARAEQLLYEVAYERLLSRLTPKLGFVIGGIATKYLVPESPATKDVDIFIQESITQKHDLLKATPESRAKLLHKLVQDQLIYENKPDNFKFIIADDIEYFTDLNPNQMAVRIQVSAYIANKLVAKFPLDVGLPDRKTPTKNIFGKDKLAFANVSNPVITVICPEYILADKAIIYQKQMLQPDVNRVRDLVHMVLIVQNIALDEDKLAHGLALYAAKVGITTNLKNTLLENTSETWEVQFNKIADECHLSITNRTAIGLINATIDPIRGRAAQLAKKYVKSMKGQVEISTSNKDTVTKDFLLDSAINRIRQE